MTRARSLALIASLLLAATGCDSSDPPTDAGTRPDTGTGGGMDSGTGGGTDSGPTTSDPCRASDTNPIASLGCNGGIYGSTPMDNQIGGSCTVDNPDDPGPGSCTAATGGAQAICAPDEEGSSAGTCLYACPPAAAYVTTGGCPTGSRCFTLDTDFALCFRDCNTAADCFSGEECDDEGSCVQPPAGDAGPPGDGGPASDAGPAADGGTPASDGGTPASDAGAAPDAGA